MTDTFTPEDVRALIGRAEANLSMHALVKAAGVTESPEAAYRLIEDMRDALSALLAREEVSVGSAGSGQREDAGLEDVLDRIESSISLAFEGEGEAWSDQLSGDRLANVATRAVEPITDRLLSRVRTAEAERDTFDDLAQTNAMNYADFAQMQEERDEARDALGRITDHLMTHHDDRMSPLGGPPVPARVAEVVLSLLLARTVETAEEWEYGVDWSSGPRGSLNEWTGWAWRNDLTGASRFAANHLDGKVIGRRPAGPSEPVPPTPEKRMLITHPHDGHGPDDTCFDCSAPTPEDADRA